MPSSGKPPSDAREDDFEERLAASRQEGREEQAKQQKSPPCEVCWSQAWVPVGPNEFRCDVCFWKEIAAERDAEIGALKAASLLDQNDYSELAATLCDQDAENAKLREEHHRLCVAVLEDRVRLADERDMGLIEGLRKEHRAVVASLRLEVERLRGVAWNMLDAIRSGSLGSMGSINNVHLPQISVRSVERWHFALSSPPAEHYPRCKSCLKVLEDCGCDGYQGRAEPPPIQTLERALEILEAIIYASDGCQGHRNCNHSMQPWKDARAFLFPPEPPPAAAPASPEGEK